MDIKLKNKRLYFLLSLICIYLLAFSIIAALDVSRNRNYLRKDPFFKSRNFASQLFSYYDNVKIYEGIVEVTGDNKKEIQGTSEKFLKSYKSIKYYITDKKSGKVWTNIENFKDLEEYIKEHAMHTESFPRDYVDDIYLYNLEEINKYFKYNNLEGKFIILKDANIYDQLIENINYYNSKKSRIMKEIVLGIISLILCIGTYITFVRKRDEHLLLIEKVRNVYGRIPLDIRAFIFLISFLFMYNYIKFMNFFYWPINAGHFMRLTMVALYTIYVILSLSIVIDMSRDKAVLKCHFHGSIAYRFIKLIIESFRAKGIMGKVILDIIFTMLCGIAFFTTLLAFFERNDILFFVSVFYIIFYFFIIFLGILRKIVYLNKIVLATDEIAEGNLDCFIEEKGKGKILTLAKNINNMKDCFKKSVESQVKSERMKSELITNVSHDLKTPLTSIVNYVDLLKKEDLSIDEQKSYIEILDRKSQRLKTLIEDLFEAAKMSSNSVEFDIERIDVVSLLRQTLGEFDEKIRNSSLNFKVDCPDRKIYADLDGKKTWRVFENLISNILKYSMENTRVYINVTETSEYIIISMKNISAYEMDFSSEEIFERFKRGDKSRNTEGSGLGLAIAKSIVELQKGKMNIDVDGDLFKVTIGFRKSQEIVY